ncbi:MAG TPA: AAA family ATPase [Bacteroidia bacterium]
MEKPNALIIIRGLPGSGKSSLATLLSENGQYQVCAIDDYFVDENGHYIFNFKDNHLAYKACQDKVEAAMKRGESKIFLDNVFSLEWEMEPYFKLAAEYQYRVHVVTTENRHGGKNLHGVEEDSIKKMALKYKVVLY